MACSPQRSGEIAREILAIYGLAILVELADQVIAVAQFMLIYIAIGREEWLFAIGGTVFM